MLEACQPVKLSVTQLSFARALTETRLFLKLLLVSTEMQTCGLPFGQRTYVVAHNTAFDTNQIVDSPGIGRNIEGKVVAWRIVAKTTNVSTGRHHHCLNPKHVRGRKNGFFC